MPKIALLNINDESLYNFRLPWIRAFKLKGFDVYAITPNNGSIYNTSNYDFTVIECKISRVFSNPFKEIPTIFKLYKLMREYKFDILHTFSFKPNVYGSIAGRLAGVRNIINTVEGLGYMFSEDNFRTRIVRLIMMFFYRISFGIARKVIFLNLDDFTVLKKLLSASKVVFLPGIGVDTEYYSQRNLNEQVLTSLKNKIKIPEGSIVVTIITRLLWHKGIKEFVESADILTKKYRNLVFLVVGAIDTGNLSAIPGDFVSANSKKPYMRFIGGRKDIRELLGITDIFVYPSVYREGLPRAILEAMAMEKPIVTTNIPGCKDTVEDGINGFIVEPKNSHQLAVAIEKLVLDGALRKKMGLACKDKVDSRFSNYIVIPKVISMYDDLLTN